MSFSVDSLPQVLQRRRSEAGPERGLDSEANRLILDRYGPPGVVVDGDLQIVQFRGQTGPFLEPAPGEANLHLLKMARKGLLYPLRTALTAARKAKKSVRREGIRIDDPTRDVAIEVVPLSALGRPHYLVLFEELRYAKTEPPRRAGRTRLDAATKPSAAVGHLERELAASREYMQSIIQELEAANEELQSANEEILSSNEELQSTNEELDTAKEELQSTNEELQTVNEELHARNEEISRVNSDLMNLLASVQIAIVIVGPDLRIRRFTPMAEKVLNLIPADLDRPISHINPNIDCPHLEQLIIESMDTVTPIERDVRDRTGNWFSLRIRPYKSVQNKIEGAVLALFDVDILKKSEQQAQRAEELASALVMAATDPVALIGRDLRVRAANREFGRLLGLLAEDMRGRTLTDLGGKAWNLDAWHRPGADNALQPTVVEDRTERGRWQLKATIVQPPDQDEDALILVVATKVP